VRRAAFALLLLGCGSPPGIDAGPVDGGNAEPLWARLGCVAAGEEPEIGVHRFCPAVHDYVREMPSGAWSFCDGEAVADAGPDSGCVPADVGWSTVENCDSWVSCPVGGDGMDASSGGPCYQCIEWGENPGAF
jgi:hypothetical protein